MSVALRSVQAESPWIPVPAKDDRFRVVFDGVKDGIFISGPATGRFVDVNVAGCEMYGYSKAEIVGGDIGLLSSGIHPYTLDEAIKTGRKAASEGPQTVEWQGRKKSGALFWTEISITLTTIEGAPVVLAIVRDISERKQLVEDLKLALHNVSAASNAKSAFLATMSHELRTPLNAIIGFSDLMLSEPLGPLGHARYLEYVGDIHKSGQHLLALINDVLDLSRIDAGKSPLFEEQVSVEEVVAEASRFVAPQAAQAHLEFATEIAADLPRVRGDERRLKQIVLNLLANAVKFTPPGGKVAVKAFRSESGLTIQICDTGIGIAKADLPKVFERFGQVDNTLTRKYEGTGLGLPLAKQLIELHGGTLHIDSELGAGTTVSAMIPKERIVPTKSGAPN